MHKGLWDSVFKLYRDSLGEYSNSPIISPYYNFLSGKDNCIKGKLAYECGLTVKDDYKVTDFPEDVKEPEYSYLIETSQLSYGI